MAAGRIRWLLDDHLTQYSLRQPFPVDPLAHGTWHHVTSIENNTGYRDNPLTLWQQPAPE